MRPTEIKDFIRRKAVESPKYISGFFRWLDRATADYTNFQAFGLWVAAVLTGIAAVAYARIFQLTEHLSFQWYSNLGPYVFFATPLLMVLAWWLVEVLAPSASGSGIPQVMAAIETKYEGTKISFVDRLLSFKTIVVKIFSSLACVAAGGAIGREGPTLQISAAIFHLIGKFVRRFFPNSDEQTWVITGAAAGLASAFNTPLGGIVYAIEELGMHHFHRVRTALLTAVIISGLVAQGLIGSYLYLGYPQIGVVTGSQWPLILLVAAVSGLTGSFFAKVLIAFSRRRKQIANMKVRGLIALACGCAISALVYYEPLSHGSGAEVIAAFLFKGESASASLTVSRILGTSLAYLSGAAGGVFAPSLAIGACIGSKLSFLFQSTNVSLFAMLGMIGFLTGVTHTPFTSFILVMEMSDRHSAIFPMMVTALIANSIAKSVSPHSFYESVRDDILRPLTAQ